MLGRYDIPLDKATYQLTSISDIPRSLSSETNKLLDKKGIEEY